MRTITITANEYAQLYGCTPRNVIKNLNNGIGMAHMRSFRKAGGSWLIDVSKEWYDSKNSGCPF